MATPNKNPEVNPMGGIPAPGAVTHQPVADMHPDLIAQPQPQESSIQTGALNDPVQTDAQLLEQTTAPTTTKVETQDQPAEVQKQQETISSKEKAIDDVDFSKFLALDNNAPLIPKDKKTDTTPVIQPQSTVVAQPETRDYTPYETIFGKENIADFKKMGNDPFRKLEPILKKHLDLEAQTKTQAAEIAKLREGRVPDSYYENEKAFLLTPDFQEAVGHAQQADAIAKHWENQLTKVRAGEETYQSLAYDSNGEIITTAPQKIDANAEATIMRAMITTQQQAAQAKATLGSIQQNFITKHKESLGQLQAWESRAFAAFERPEFKPLVDDTVRALLPPVFHTNPLAQCFAKLFLVNNALVKRQTEMQQASGNGHAATTKVAVNDKQAAGPQPNLGVQGAGSVKNGRGGDSVTIDDFEKRLNGV